MSWSWALSSGTLRLPWFKKATTLDMVLMGLITLSFHFRYLTDKGYTRTQSLSKDSRVRRRFKHLRLDWIILDRHKAAEMPLWRIFLTKKTETWTLHCGWLYSDSISLESRQVGLPKHYKNTTWKRLWENAFDKRQGAGAFSDLLVLTDKSDWFRSSLDKKYHDHRTLPSEMASKLKKEEWRYGSANNTV